MVGQCVHVDPRLRRRECGTEQIGVRLPPGHDRPEDRLACASASCRSVEHRRRRGSRDCADISSSAVSSKTRTKASARSPGSLIRLGGREGAVELGRSAATYRVHQRARQLELRREVVEERALGRRRGIEHLVDRGGGEAVIDDQVLGGVEDAIAGGGSVSGHKTLVPDQTVCYKQTNQSSCNETEDVCAPPSFCRPASYVTDGGLETDLIFHHGVDLPEFASFPLIEQTQAARAPARSTTTGTPASPEGRRRPDARGADVAGQPRLGQRLGYDAAALDRVNRDSIDVPPRAPRRAPGAARPGCPGRRHARAAR